MLKRSWVYARYFMKLHSNLPNMIADKSPRRGWMRQGELHCPLATSIPTNKDHVLVIA